MKQLRTIVLIILMLKFYSCKTDKYMRESFDVISIRLPASSVVAQINNKENLKEWKIELNNEFFFIQEYCDNSKKSNISKDSTVLNPLSLYNGYLSVNPLEKKNYDISYLNIQDYKLRLIKRLYSTGKYFVELNGEAICGKNCIIQIIGAELSKDNFNVLIQSFETIEFKCE